MNRIPVIFNPAARGEKARSAGERIAQLSERAWLRPTGAPGEARELARAAVAEGCRTIVAAGGDGTINEVVNGIAGADVNLGLLPVGTMNVFAAELGLPCNDLQRCWQIIETAKPRLIDLARANGTHYFVQLGGVGLDAQVITQTPWHSKKALGPLSYLISAARIAGRKPPRLLVETPERSLEGSFVLIGNGRFYGGPFLLFNEARIDDGLLDVLIFKNLGYLDIVRYLHGILTGTHRQLADVEYLQSPRLRVSSAGEVPMEVDGEVIGHLPVEFEVLPMALRVLV